MIDSTPIPWPEFRAQLEALNAPPSRAPATWGKMRQVLGILEGLGVERTDQLDIDLVARFRGALAPTLSSHTTKSLLSTLRTICSTAQERRYVAVSPFALRKMSKWVKVAPIHGKRNPAPSEVKALLARE